MAKITKQRLGYALTEINEMFFEEEGDFYDVSATLAQMKASLKEAAGDFSDDDEISAETAETLDDLKLKYAASITEEEEEEEIEEEEELEEEEEDEEEDEAEEEDEEEDEELSAEAEAAIAKVQKSKKLDAIKAIAKEFGIRIPPPFLKTIKKLKPYVIGKLEAGPTKKADKKPAKKAAAVSCFGHRQMAGEVDEQLNKGAKHEDIVKALMDKFGRTEGAAKAKISAHIKHLEGLGYTINEMPKSKKLVAKK